MATQAMKPVTKELEKKLNEPVFNVEINSVRKGLWITIIFITVGQLKS